MPPPPPDGLAAGDRLRHDLPTPVTVISARLGMIQRTVAGSVPLGDAERVRILADAESIQQAPLAICGVGDGFAQDGRYRDGA